MDCADVLGTLLGGRPLDAAARAHVEGCAACRAEVDAVAQVGRVLAADPAPVLPPGLAARVREAAAPLLARHAQRVARRTLVRAIAAALVPLPLILLLDFWIVRTAHALLSAVLPAEISMYVVFNYTVMLAFLLALTYGAVPILAERQRRGLYEERHA